MDGDTGFRRALDEVLPGTRLQRCWGHETANVLNKLPKSMHPAVKADLREIRGVLWLQMKIMPEKAVPDFSTLSRRRKTLAVNIPYRGTKEPSRLLIDSTALGTPATEAMG